MITQEIRIALETSSINVENVMSVYSGKDGRCCCGCSGKHTYASATREKAGKNRGYEISDRTVKMIVRKMNQFPGQLERTQLEGFTAHYSVVVNERLYIAYLNS